MTFMVLPLLKKKSLLNQDLSRFIKIKIKNTAAEEQKLGAQRERNRKVNAQRKRNRKVNAQRKRNGTVKYSLNKCIL